MRPGEQRPASVGLPAGPEIVVLGPDGTFLAPGQVGEIAIRGPNVTSGYDGNPEVNRAAFAEDWFRTGDEGCFDPDGFLYLRGRLREIINRGGEKISPREIDDVLTGHPAVTQAAAFSMPHASLGEDVAAAVVLKSDRICEEAELRAFCFQHLADHKVPTRIVFVDTIPKGASGKLQRFALAEALDDKLNAGYDAPNSQVETLVAELFAEVTGVERVGINDNFFTLGGDSIRGLQLVSRIQAALQVELSPVALFRHPTVALLAQEVSRAAEALYGASIEDLLSEIEAMSDAEAEALLNGMDSDQNDSATGGCPRASNW
jgi:non-ribosomal peptide synthetase component F